MKTKMLTLSFVLMVVGLSTMFAQEVKTEKLKVNGNCGMCKTRIEKAAKSVDGVSSANWNDETKILAVTYNSAKTDVKKVNAAIAKAGHDTETAKATDKDYKSLPACCQYERKKEL